MTSGQVRATLANGAHAVLLYKLAGYGVLSAAETNQVRLLVGGSRTHTPRTELFAEGQLCPARMVVTGWGCRQRILTDGRRQIVSFLMPGDFIGPVLKPRLRAPCSAVAITLMETVDVTALVELAQESAADHPTLTRAIHLLDRMEEFILRNHVVRLGRQTAFERTLHLFLEFRDRMVATGLGEAERFAMPLTQEILADALGLSAVHLNRVLQQARREGLLELRGGVVTLLRTELIEVIADWQQPPEPAE